MTASTVGLYIDGQETRASSGETFETLNPATGEVICQIDMANEADVDKAVASAQVGFKVWSQMAGAERGRILGEAARILRSRNETIAALEVKDTGKPIAEALSVDILSGADAIEYFAGLADKVHGSHFDLPPSAFAYTRREPLGVCAGIGAWNYPIQIGCWKSAPALATGALSSPVIVTIRASGWELTMPLFTTRLKMYTPFASGVKLATALVASVGSVIAESAGT